MSFRATLSMLLIMKRLCWTCITLGRKKCSHSSNPTTRVSLGYPTPSLSGWRTNTQRYRQRQSHEDERGELTPGLPSPVPLLRNQHADANNNAGFLVPVRLVWGKPVVAEGAVGNPKLLPGEVVVHRRYGAEVVVFFAPLKVDDLSFLCYWWSRFRQR